MAKKSLAPLDTQDVLILWGEVWINAHLLDRIREAVEKMFDPDLADDVAADLQEKLAGRKIYRTGQIPARLRKVIGL